MVLDSKQTTVAYRCPHCGAGVMSAVNVFTLGADMIKLKCTCGQSEMTVVSGNDGKVRLTVPCLVCPKPHLFTLNASLFYGKDLFTMQCPYASELTLAMVGDAERVKAELARTELELLDLMEKNGIKDPEGLREQEASLSDPQVLDIVMFVIHDMDAEGKIYCKCDACDNGRQYEAEILDEGVRVSCKKCAAARLIPTDSNLSAHAFLNADALYLE